MGALSLPVSVTYANHAAFVTGVDPTITGVHGNHTWTDHGWMPAPKLGPRATTLFERVRAAGGTSAMVVGDQKLVGQMGGSSADVGVAARRSPPRRHRSLPVRLRLRCCGTRGTRLHRPRRRLRRDPPQRTRHHVAPVRTRFARGIRAVPSDRRCIRRGDRPAHRWLGPHGGVDGVGPRPGDDHRLHVGRSGRSARRDRGCGQWPTRGRPHSCTGRPAASTTNGWPT